jgi:hypothetical protein
LHARASAVSRVSAAAACPGVGGRGLDAQPRDGRQLGRGRARLLLAGGEGDPDQRVLIQPVDPRGGHLEPPGLRRARRHVLDRLRGDLGRVGGLQPPLGLGGLPLGKLGVLIVGIAAQRARGGQPFHQGGIVQPRGQPVRARRPWLRPRTVA